MQLFQSWKHSALYCRTAIKIKVKNNKNKNKDHSFNANKQDVSHITIFLLPVHKLIVVQVFLSIHPACR